MNINKHDKQDTDEITFLQLPDFPLLIPYM